MEEQVTHILADYCNMPADEIHRESSLTKDLKLNSLDIINLVVEFEESFDIEIQEADVRAFQTVGDVTDYLSEHVHLQLQANPARA